MPSIDRAGASCVAFNLNRFVSPRSVFRLSGVVSAAALLAACAQSSGSRQAALQQERTTSPAISKRVAVRHTPFAAPQHAAGGQMASQGLASFYTEGTRTANGEKFDTNELTAAHPTLPFGTRVKVTNVTSGRSVTVRINDRGPYVAGRVVDVSYSAANALGMVGRGVAKVKLDVVQ